jgi:hypothetical protein
MTRVSHIDAQSSLDVKMRKADELELGGRFKPNTTTASFMAQSLANIVLHLIFSTSIPRRFFATTNAIACTHISPAF